MERVLYQKSTSNYGMKFKKSLLLVLLLALFVIPQAYAQNRYVTATGQNGTGASWSSPWVGFSNIQWASLTPGSVLCLAGGTYSGTLTIGASGNTSSTITIKRATAADPQCGTSVTGWTNSFDSTVNLSAINNGGNSYLTIDGQVSSGIKITYRECGDGVLLTAGQNLTLINTEIQGPGVGYNYITGSSGCAGSTAGVYIPATRTFNNLTLRNIKNHDTTNGFWISHCTNLTIENSELYNIGAGNEDNGSNNGPHSNLAYLEYVNNLTFRYNNVYNYRSTGLYPSLDGVQSTGWKIYGNVFHDAPAFVVSTGRGSTQVEMYNNTIYNVGDRNGNILNMVNGLAGSAFYNNIFWNTGAVSYNDASASNNFYQTGLWWIDASEPGVVINATDPITNAAGGNFTLKVGSKAIDAGRAITSVAGHSYNLDRNGTSRPQGNAWDIGAYEYQSGTTTTPGAPTGLRIN